MASPAPTARGWTYHRYLELDDEHRYEILDGELLMTPAPGTRHQRIVEELQYRFARWVRQYNTGLLLPAPTDVVLAEDVVVQPDLLFIRAARVAEIVDERAVQGAPDLVVEILSPSSLERDRHRKREQYRRYGVPEFWIVDPANRAIEVLALQGEEYRLASFAANSGAVASRVLEGFAVSVAEVMEE
ncbi:Uma2 family endonuclease [soil metagenome]|nr:Uma2 family endonuclease [Gemmatimonadota bacterium]